MFVLCRQAGDGRHGRRCAAVVVIICGQVENIGGQQVENIGGDGSFVVCRQVGDARGGGRYFVFRPSSPKKSMMLSIGSSSSDKLRMEDTDKSMIVVILTEGKCA